MFHQAKDIYLQILMFSMPTNYRETVGFFYSFDSNIRNAMKNISKYFVIAMAFTYVITVPYNQYIMK